MCGFYNTSGCYGFGGMMGYCGGAVGIPGPCWAIMFSGMFSLLALSCVLNDRYSSRTRMIEVMAMNVMRA